MQHTISVEHSDSCVPPNMITYPSSACSCLFLPIRACVHVDVDVDVDVDVHVHVHVYV